MPTKSVHVDTTMFIQADEDEETSDSVEAIQGSETEDPDEQGGILSNAYVILSLMMFFVFCVMYIVYIIT